MDHVRNCHIFTKTSMLNNTSAGAWLVKILSLLGGSIFGVHVLYYEGMTNTSNARLALIFSNDPYTENEICRSDHEMLRLG